MVSCQPQQAKCCFLCICIPLLLTIALVRSTQLLLNNYIATMNAALRYVAATDGLVLIDLEAIAVQLPAAHLYLDDGMHPRGGLTRVTMNLLLNEYERHSGTAVAA